MTLVPFQPQPNSVPPFQATVTLDGVTYGLSCAWNIFRGGFYYTITDQSGVVTYTGALVGSPAGQNIYLAPGIFSTSTILYRTGTGNFEIVP